MRIVGGVMLSVSLAACGSAQPGAVVPIPSEEAVRVGNPQGGGTDVRILREDFIARAEIPAQRAAVWQALPDAFRDVGLPAPVMDPAKSMAIVENHVLARTLGRERLSKFLACGSGISGDYADTRRIRLTVRAGLETQGAYTIMMTRVEASAQPTDGTNTPPNQCLSRAALEAAIAKAVTSRVTGGGDAD